jgi:hypothetical protein
MSLDDVIHGCACFSVMVQRQEHPNNSTYWRTIELHSTNFGLPNTVLPRYPPAKTIFVTAPGITSRRAQNQLPGSSFELNGKNAGGSQGSIS